MRRLVQPLKWVGALLVLGVVVAYAAPAAFDHLSGAVEFEEEANGLLDDPEDMEEFDPPDDPVAGANDEDGIADGEDAPDEVDEEEARTYTVEPGDDLESIARDLYGDPGRWGDIAEANEIENPGEIQVGQELIIP